MENKNHEEELKGGKSNPEFYIQIGIIAVLALVIVFNAGKIYANNGSDGITGAVTGSSIGTVSASEIIPKGVPEIYGKELGVSYDDVSANNLQLAEATIEKLTEYEDKQLTAEQLERYKRIGSSIACEYCCGAKALIFSNGERACGCAHSYAMRGVAKYLLIEHGDEFTDEEILNELGKWKVLFFPGIHEQKAQVLESQGIDSSDYINLASNKYRGIETSAPTGTSSSGGMVGGC